MKGDTTQPTPISKEEYVKFKQWVQDVHGSTRGHLKTEIEKALREHRQPDSKEDRLARIEDDVATIEANVAMAQTDGGSVADTPESDDVHARADSTNTPDSKPATNAPRTEKVQWIISEYYKRSGGETTPVAIRRQLKDEFSFSDRTAEDYIDLVLDELNAEPHPMASNDLHAWGENLKQAKEELREQAENEAKDEMDRIS
jgi:hypothetical protein